jgi:predicted transcriptional regulator
MKNLYRLSVLITFVFFSACSNGNKEIKSDENKIDLSKQEVYEKLLANMGISIHEKATFDFIKKTNDGNYKLVYKVEPFENIQDSLQSYYEQMLDNTLLTNGWEKPKEGWGQHGTLYKNDKNFLKFFILVSEKHNVYELAFKYGQ